jgi:molybdopterin biosynthesis enzyme
MDPTQRLPASLTSLDAALAALLRNLAPVTPIELPLVDAVGCVAADIPRFEPVPPRDVAANDGWAFSARDLVGASSYSPLSLAAPPIWIEAGAPMPDRCDCIVDADAVEQTGSIVQIMAEAVPGQGVRRAGSHVAGGMAAIGPGRTVTARDLLVARSAGLQRLSVRRPRLRLVNIPAISGDTATAELIAESARASGAEVVRADATGRDAESIANALDTDACDFLVTIGGSGVGRTDATIAALAKRGDVLAHGIALQPGRTAALGRIGAIPVAALPGAPDQALGVWWMIALAALDRLSARNPRPTQTLPLHRKIASQVGIAEIALLEKSDHGWMPISVGDLSLAAIARADGLLVVPGTSEGFAAGTPVDAYILRDE